MGRFGKRDDLVVHQQEPFNAETGIESLGDPVTVSNFDKIPPLQPPANAIQTLGPPLS